MILQEGQPLLRQLSVDVTTFDAELFALAADMAYTMARADGIGLAAPQVGRSIRLIVVAAERPPAVPFVMVNPRITKARDYQRSEEGCLSIAKSKWNQPITRSKFITVEYQDLDGEPWKMKLHGLLSRVVQHEIDHLDGKLFIDYVKPKAPTLVMRAR